MSGIGPISGRADIAQVLAEMKSLRSQVQRPELPANEISPTRVQGTQEVSETPKFGDLFTNAVNAVNENQQKSSAMATAYEQGDPNVSLASVMIQSQKASVSFEALTQVRNKVVKAYEDIMNMPV